MRTLLWIIACLFLLGVGQAAADNPLTNTEGTGPCNLAPGKTCFHLWASTDTLADADSSLYPVSMCSAISYRKDGDGTSTAQIMECAEKSKTGDCEIITPDMNNDGEITSADEDIVLDGVVGTRGYEGLRPRSGWHYVNALALPGTGTARVSVTCHP